DGDPLRGEKGETHLRYNVSGIELDPARFVKLQSEITLQRLELPATGDDHPAILQTGRYPDLKGTMQRLVIREGSMRLLDLQEPHLGKPTTNSFYEVVTDEVLLNQVDESVKTAQYSTTPAIRRTPVSVSRCSSSDVCVRSPVTVWPTTC